MKIRTPFFIVLSTALFLSFFTSAASSAPNSPKLPVKVRKETREDVYQLFRTPDNRHYPYARWWWNGSRISEKEILRELDIMDAAGIRGVEINTISFHADMDTLHPHYPAIPVLSDEWVRMINVAADGCKERGMTCDMIIGSGWPYGGEFLPRSEQIQMLTIETFDLKGGTTFSIPRSEILDKVNPPVFSPGKAPEKELLYLRLMPKHIGHFTEGVAYNNLVTNDTITLDVPKGEHVLYCFVKLTGYMYVIEGAPGAGGPVLNHFDGEAVRKYLDRFSNCLNFKNGNLKGKIRATFTDSFELEGANWSAAMLDEFEKRMGYSLYPYLPYVIEKVGHMGDRVDETYGSEFSPQVTEEIVNRVRNDFEHVKIAMFRENFIDVYNQWCHENGLKSRVQAYGRDLHPIEASMYIDIPECETWFWGETGLVFPENNYLNGRNYSMINKFVSSGSFLSGHNIVSCEEVTNVVNIFQASLEEIKIVGDMSNLSGVNHSVLHGFNYSPNLEAAFPGWIKFGAYFSESNTWWPYMRLWADYKARISAVLQNSELQADIAVLHPLEDLWSKHGQQRDPFPAVVYPKYAHGVWEAIHQSGNGCDFVSENIIQQSKVRNGQLTFGPRSYKTILLIEVSSLAPETAQMLSEFVEKGGRIICIGEAPHQSWGKVDAQARDAKVSDIMAKIKQRHPDRLIETAPPANDEPVLDWWRNIQQLYNVMPFVRIEKPNKFFSQNYYKAGKRDIFFFVNYNIENSVDMHIGFPASVKGKQPWLWDTETGERYMLSASGEALNLHFGPAETKMIVFDTDRNGKMLPVIAPGDSVYTVNGMWALTANHIDKTTQTFQIDSLVDLNTLPMPWLRHFAGVLEYTTEIDVDDPSAFRILDAGLTNNGVTELWLNGEKVGVKWYGERKFNVSGKLKKGDNAVTIKVTTLLGNYTKSSKDNPVSQRWADWQSYRPIGLSGPVRLY